MQTIYHITDDAPHTAALQGYSVSYTHNEFVLTFTKNDPTLVEINVITLNLGHMSDQSGNCTGQHQKCLDVRLLFHALHCYRLRIATKLC